MLLKRYNFGHPNKLKIMHFAPQRMEGLNDIGPPPFLTKTYDMVNDINYDHIVCWSRNGNSFVVWDSHAFSNELLPIFFKHNNFSSFVRQFYTYGFKKIDPDKWEFANEGFSRGQKHLLKSIRRRKAPTQLSPSQQQALGSCLELKTFKVDGEIDCLLRDKQILTVELLKLRQRQQNTRAQLQVVEMKLQGTEIKQQQMMSFLARAIQNPDFVKQSVQHKGNKKELGDTLNKKRQRPIEEGESSQSCHRLNPVKAEPFDSRDFYGNEVSELEALALEMQGIGKARIEEGGNIKEFNNEDRDTDDGFWEQLLNEKINVESSFCGEEEGEEDDVDVLASRLDHWEQAPRRSLC